MNYSPLFSWEGIFLGGALLRPMLDRIDKEGLPSYFETHDEKNVPLYEHFGFKVIEKANIPGLDVTNWAMLREKGQGEKQLD